MTIKKEIIYPIFLECCQYTNDIYWENIFQDLAYGKTPYGTYISKDSICCNYKNKEFNYKIEQKNPEQLYNDVYFLFHKKFGLLSQRDKINKKIDFYNIEDEMKNGRKSWANIRKKNIKDLLIENYVIDMKNKYLLSTQQTKYLLSIIFIAMTFKVICSKDILYEEGKIKNINGIQLKKKQIIVERDIYNITNNNNCILIDPNLMCYTWEKYLLYLKKLIL
jgi:hypothetical protein